MTLALISASSRSIVSFGPKLLIMVANPSASIGHGALIIDWLDAAPLDTVPLGQLADRIVAFLRERRKDPQAQISWPAPPLMLSVSNRSSKGRWRRTES